ncbi:conserved hypothetical protein (DUF1200) [Formosa agariphila KMM 3901]|uniref:Uncharacterized protein YyaB-like PH domain-containing protein n=1 Tax=Formosa agariphila (strain DSM 15362 / KCTC 12365 / LMG 23005 / KMM 3901 / M-2Alg 35-1) TaxID=1347342 RepID=T2KJZ7_FORAG|nr:PH domain-containing protein [Formosa agariphila]CDF79090.1 conserved hypothetical protein (DUF1200) [Formosa agariphila KMM 3901]
MTIYKSKFGYETIILLTLILVCTLGFMIYNNEPVEAMLTVGGVFALVYTFCLYISFKTKYTIADEGTLKLTCGFLYSKTYDIQKITSISESNNLMSSPAPSIDRLELSYAKYDLIIVSPKDQIGFANLLKSLNPNIVNKLIG